MDSTTPTEAGSTAGFAQTAYSRPFRRYQGLALEGFERARAAGRRRAYLVLPPGAGKTVLGLEVARRLGNRALVLAPNTAVQAQWLRQWQDFAPATVLASASTEVAAPLTVLTYQALCVLETDDETLDELARDLWRVTLAADGELSEDQAEVALRELAESGTDHYDAELARFRRRARRLVARGGSREQLLGLLHPNGRAVIEAMKSTGPWTLVLDECHHLLELWGYLVRALVEELGAEVFVVGLTATPPGDLDTREAALYLDLFGHADFEVPTPAVVKEGDLAPYQELAYLTRPMAHETEYIAAQHARFEALRGRLLEPDFASRYFVEWLRQRAGERRSRSGAQVSWARFERDEPALALAALRVCRAYQLELPADAPLREAHRRPPTSDDWVALIEDFCLGYLKTSAEPRDRAAWEEIRHALPSLGYVLTRQGIRSYVSPVDRVLALSASKAAAVLRILGVEQEALGEQLRALVLCDYERAGRDVLAKLRGVLDPQAGSAALLLHILTADPLAARLNPLLVTGRTVAGSRQAAVDLVDWLEGEEPDLRETVTLDRLFAPAAGADVPAWDDVVVVRPAHPRWQPRHYVPLLTRYFEAGRSQCLIGTRGLLGEGWDAKRVNVLVDLTAASTATSVHQMRGRSIRLDPALPRKVANNWDVICIDPDHPKGAADYARFVRKHRHYYAPTGEGEIESGVSHVHHALSPYGPPTATAFDAINRELLERARDRERVYERWEIGKPYGNEEVHTARLTFRRSIGVPGRRLVRRGELAASRFGLGWRSAAVAAAASGAGLAGALAGSEIAGVVAGLGTAAGGIAWLGASIARSLSRLAPSDALEDLAIALAEALAATGGTRACLSGSAVRVVVQSDGYYRCYLAGATSAESQVFAVSLEELLAPLAAPRYLIPRFVADPPQSTAAALGLWLRQAVVERLGSRVVYHTVPSYLAANRERVDAFTKAWNRYVSAGTPLYYRDARAEAILELQRGADPFEVTSELRTLWR